VLAIGIVVDDAIVVVENVERNLARGMTPKQAAHVTMDEVGTAVIAISLVLIAVFVPTAFIPGISGQFYKQFAVTISVTTAISALNSLTLSPALGRHPAKNRMTMKHEARNIARASAAACQRLQPRLRPADPGYSWIIHHLVSSWIGLTLARFVRLLGGDLLHGAQGPAGFIPTMDQGYAIVVVQLPDGASLARTDAVVKQVGDIVRKVPGVGNAVQFAGFSGATFTNASNAGVVFTLQVLRRARGRRRERQPDHRPAVRQAAEHPGSLHHRHPAAIGPRHRQFRRLQDADRRPGKLRHDPRARPRLSDDGRRRHHRRPDRRLHHLLASSPQYFLAIDRDKARFLNVPIPNIFNALSINLGVAYVNDFNAFGRVYQVRAQADQQYRMEREDILALKVRSATGALVPLGTLMDIQDSSGPALVQRYNMYVSVPLQGNPTPGHIDRHSTREDGGAGRQDPAAGHLVRMDGTRLPGNPHRQHGDLHLRALGDLRLPGAGRPV
jgi:HAE1 family hydrophobic/amphiphilic exporter-1